ncbi:hypothetical protein [Deinococcus cellulosilyticus]|uniref:Uncharacterized protein n=1 Tax=Deinococcus cellulosilyticus (strain DSM 18568 / NBRC 106333 / KACC 11606 / 5516J-15) TaxID=1223518 RepID=A0A511N4Z8_DEIC1|nr:hypothetical protein [Deinococcus cellulosilyticus]GEM47919.1 hypothetical protein DC3_35540 [Deinococcus cellulosilyticus NBRC 106333 = KACC 11606]
MNPQEIIEAYVRDVIRHLPHRDRNETGFELRGLLTEMLQEQAQQQGTAPTASMTLDMLRRFGHPSEVAQRYLPAVPAFLPGNQLRPFLLVSLTGMALQWALTLPAVFAGQSIAAWWFGPGLGAFWIPGFVVMFSLLERSLKLRGLFHSQWSPRGLQTDRVSRPVWTVGLVGFALAVLMMVFLPTLIQSLPGVLPAVLAFHPDFLPVQGMLAVFLWTASFAIHTAVWREGRWTILTRRMDAATGVGFLLLLASWVIKGNIFLQPATDEGARFWLVLVMVLILWDLLQQSIRPRVLHPPKAVK